MAWYHPGSDNSSNLWIISVPRFVQRKSGERLGVLNHIVRNSSVFQYLKNFRQTSFCPVFLRKICAGLPYNERPGLFNGVFFPERANVVLDEAKAALGEEKRQN